MTLSRRKSFGRFPRSVEMITHRPVIGSLRNSGKAILLEYVLGHPRGVNNQETLNCTASNAPVKMFQSRSSPWRAASWCNRGTGGCPGQTPRSAECNSVLRTCTLACRIANRRRFLLELRCGGLAAFFFAQTTPRRLAHGPWVVTGSPRSRRRFSSLPRSINKNPAATIVLLRPPQDPELSASISDSYLFAWNQTFFSASRKQSSSVRAAKSACS